MFHPGSDVARSGTLATELDGLVRTKLADSVAVIAAALEGLVAVSPELAAALMKIRNAPASPGLFALYHDMAVAAGQDAIETTAALLENFVALALDLMPWAKAVTLRDAELGAGLPPLYRRMIDDDEDLVVRVQSVSEACLAQMPARIAEARNLIQAADPELAAEIGVFGRQIVLAEGPAGNRCFSGAATFFLWGALVINPATNADRLTLAETLVHESGHALLFGLADAEPLVSNSPDETYPSPLRLDPRPMEGIVHATYVLARMQRFVRGALERCALTAEERVQAAEMIEASRAYFCAGLSIVEAHARFTERGRAIFERGLAAAI